MILVTGGTGLLGSHLLVELTRNNTRVRALYRNKSRIDQVQKVFQYYFKENWQNPFQLIEWFEGDILDIPVLDESMQGIELVYHCAALVSFSKRDFEVMMKINREGTANVVNCAMDAGVKKLCYVSSTAATGGESFETVTEETKWKQSPLTSGYSISKYSAEKEVWRGVEEGLDCVIVNPSVLFGAGNWDESSLTIFRTLDEGLRFYTPGQNGVVDARDVAEIMVRLATSEIKNQRFLCVAENVPFKKLFTEIALKMGKNPPTINTPRWVLGLTWRLSWLLSKFRGNAAAITRETANSAFNVMTYDSSKIKKELGFTFRSLDETIQNTIDGRLK